MSVSSGPRGPSRVIAYQTGALYPRFVDVSRAALARVLRRHDFQAAADRLVDMDHARALSFMVSKIGANRRDGLSVAVLRHPSGDHLTSFQVQRRVQSGREQARHVPVVRVYSRSSGLFVEALTNNGKPDAEGLAFAEQLRASALRLVTHADTAVVSRILTLVLDEARAYRFISKGTYMLLAGDPASDRVVRCFREVRAQFYQELGATGIRVSVIELTAEPVNVAAVRDAVVDECERESAELLLRLCVEQGRVKAKGSTLQRRLADAERHLAHVSTVRGHLRGAFVPLDGIARDLVAAYSSAESLTSVTVPPALARAAAALPKEF